MREEALGSDRLGRRYWSFAADGGRLWVEAPVGAPWQWAAYESVPAVNALVAALEEGPLRYVIK